MGGGLWGLGFVTVDMRIRKLLKRFLATPMKKSQFLEGLMISRLMFMVPEVLFLLGFSRVAFGVVNHGSMFAVAVLIFLGAVMFAGIGLLVASRANTIEAVSGLNEPRATADVDCLGRFFLVRTLPRRRSAANSGIAAHGGNQFPAQRDAGGRELGAQLPRIGIMLAWGIVSFVLALRWFRWRVRNCHGNSDRSRFRASRIFRIRKSLGPRQQCNRLVAGSSFPQAENRLNLSSEGKRMASGLTRNQMPGNRLRVRIPCPPLELRRLVLVFMVENVANLLPISKTLP